MTTAVPGSDLSLPSAAAEATDGLCILVVDDNRDSADSLALLLELSGHRTHTAYDGLEAVARAEALQPDVVLLDLGLPGIDGCEACRRIREQPWAKSALLVAVTGWGQASDKRRSQDAGFDGHLVKPVEPDALAQLIDECAGARKAR